MKNFFKQFLSIIATGLFLAIIVMSFIACDKNSDDNGTGLKPNQLTFAEDVTLDDILEMFDNGTITNCTMGGPESIYKCNENIWYANNGRIENLWESLEQWDIYDETEQKWFSISVLDGDVEYGINATFINPVDNMAMNIKTLSTFDEVKSITINQTSIKIVINYGDGDIIYSWYDFNCTQISLPEEYANYKELAIKVNSILNQ